MKLASFAAIWIDLRKNNIDELANGSVNLDLVGAFIAAAHSNFIETRFFYTLDQIENYSNPHPTDSHPPLSERIKALKVHHSAISGEDIRPSQTSPSDYFAHYKELAERLSVAEHRLMVSLGRVIAPRVLA